jgi:hypothetical protein
MTAPLPAAVKVIKNAPESVRQAAEGLRHVSVRCVNFAVDRANVTDKHWIYYPEDTVFHRIFVQSNASTLCAPAGTSSFTAEITYSPYKPLPCDGDGLIDQVIQEASERDWCITHRIDSVVGLGGTPMFNKSLGFNTSDRVNFRLFAASLARLGAMSWFTNLCTTPRRIVSAVTDGPINGPFRRERHGGTAILQTYCFRHLLVSETGSGA